MDLALRTCPITLIHLKYCHAIVILCVFALACICAIELNEKWGFVETIEAHYFYHKDRDMYKSSAKVIKQEMRYNYIRRRFSRFQHSLPQYNHTHDHPPYIFWTWLQGETNAPPLYRACLHSVQYHCRDLEIKIITDTNFQDFVQLPSFVLHKYKAGLISKTHFSDILRLALLVKYGGTWIDASVLLTEYEVDFFNLDLFFFQGVMRNDDSEVGSSWFLSSERANPILKTTYELLLEYWKENSRLYNYFLFHFFFRMACSRYSEDYRNMPCYSNVPPHLLQRELLQEFDPQRYQQLLRLSSIHKLTYMYSIVQNTFYSHILDVYL